MANLKEVRNRIKSVNSTQQITKAMKMVSAAKLRRAQDKIVQMRPYAGKLQDMLNNILQNLDGDVDLELAKKRDVNNVLIVVITSDKGLCGGYNSNILKLANNLLNEKYATQYGSGKATIMCIGKKSLDYFGKNKKNKLYTENSGMFLDLSFERSMDASEFILEQFSKKSFDAVEVIYSQFKNAASQNYVAEPLLPLAQIQKPVTVEKGKKAAARKANYIFEPSQAEIIKELIPKILKVNFYRMLLEANASEHGARMTAMDKATENANELLKELKLSYNRARQAAITTELTEIVSGANAL